MSRARWLALCALLGGGCLFPSLSDLSGGGVDASDVQASDIVSPETGPTDASDGGVDSAAIPFCLGQDAALLCDDFDDTDAATFAKWTGLSGNVVRDPDASTSVPFSILVTTPQSLDAAAPNPAARVRRTFTKAIANVSYAFDVRIDKFDTLGNRALLNMVTITSGGIDVQYRFSATLGSLQYEVHIPTGQDAASNSTMFSLSPWTAGTWHHVVTNIIATATPATVTVTVDSVTAVGPNAPAAVAMFGAGQSIEVQAGIYYATTPETGWAAHVDNVSLFQVQ